MHVVFNYVLGYRPRQRMQPVRRTPQFLLIFCHWGPLGSDSTDGESCLRPLEDFEDDSYRYYEDFLIDVGNNMELMELEFKTRFSEVERMMLCLLEVMINWKLNIKVLLGCFKSSMLLRIQAVPSENLKKKAEKKKPTDSEAEITAFDYLKSQNRPFNAVKVFQNHHKT